MLLSPSPRITTNPVSLAYPARAPLMPWRDLHPVAADRQSACWQQVCQQQVVAGKRLAYVHIPFCANHCLFCNFFNNKYRSEDSRRYADAVIRELRIGRDSGLNGTAPVHALYFGGGTPTALATEDLVRLICACREYLPLASDCEVTLEGRIAHFDDEKIDACLDAGINRISIGVQSFNTKVRQSQGRKVCGPDAQSFIAALIARNKAAIVIDLMYGLPYQNVDIWRNDLQVCLDLEPDGIDTYCLSLFPGSPLAQAINNGKLPDVNPLQEQGHFYQIAQDMLAGAGWLQLSNTHWACSTRERNLYNLLIKGGAEVLAFGSGAGGSRHGYSYIIDSNLNNYLTCLDKGEKPISQLLQADNLQPLRHWCDMQFERGFINLENLYRQPELQNINTEALQPLLTLWQDAGLIRRHEQTIRLTTAGRFWASNLITEFNKKLLGLIAGQIPLHTMNTSNI